MDFLPLRADHTGGLAAAHHGPGRDTRRAIGNGCGDAFEAAFVDRGIEIDHARAGHILDQVPQRERLQRGVTRRRRDVGQVARDLSRVVDPVR